MLELGDVLAFSDTDIVSKAIEGTTGGNVAHVAVALSEQHIIESAIHQNKGFVGVDVQPIHYRLSQFERSGGQVWLLKLNRSNKQKIKRNRLKYVSFLMEQIGKEYSYIKAVGAGVDVLDKQGITENKESLEKLFCSELISYSYELVDIFPESFNSAEITPIDLCRYMIYSECIQLVGNKEEITGFNTVKI